MKIKPMLISAVSAAAAVTTGILIGNGCGINSLECLSENNITECTIYEERKTLIPCGTPFGIKMLTDGVVVTDFGTVNSASECISPAELAGIKKGDIITSINGISVTDSDSLSNAVQEAGAECTVEILRDGYAFTLIASPVLSSSDGKYKLGLWTRDSCAGIGTMTFYDPDECIFGGLGHSVSDISTGLTLPLLEGEITAVTITDILKGTNGMPGELCGSFISDKETGTIEINSDYGIFGYSDIAPVLNEPMEIGYDEEIKKGKATIFTTVSGMTPSEYEIEIEKIDYGSKSSSRNMTIRITDEELIEATGGIVQGMSGSPIIQNGRIIGAVTHVLVNDSSMGYGIFIENMYNAAEKLEIN